MDLRTYGPPLLASGWLASQQQSATLAATLDHRHPQKHLAFVLFLDVIREFLLFLIPVTHLFSAHSLLVSFPYHDISLSTTYSHDLRCTIFTTTILLDSSLFSSLSGILGLDNYTPFFSRFLDMDSDVFLYYVVLFSHDSHTHLYIFTLMQSRPLI